MAKKRAQEAIPLSTHLPQELKGLGLLALTILLLLSLLSFSPGDVSKNWLGFLGYFISWILQYTFGLTSYLILFFLGWTGWQQLFKKPLVNYPLKLIYFTILAFSISILLNLFAEANPLIASYFRSFIHSESALISGSLNYQKVRYNLGGTPFYYLYRDLPVVNLQHMLSNVGICLVFSITAFVSFLQLTHWSLFKALKKIYFLLLRSFHFSLPKQETPVEFREASSVTPPPPSPLKPTSILQRPPVIIEPRFEKRLPLKNAPIESKSLPPSEESLPSISIPTPDPTPTLKPALKSSKRDIALNAQRIVNGDYSTYQLPPLSLLTESKKSDQSSLKKDLHRQAQILEETLLSFGIEAKVGQIYCGPTIISFEVHPAIGVKVQKIKSLESDIALNLEAKSIRILAPIPGKAAVGIEVPNPKPQEVGFKEMLLNYQQGAKKFSIPAILGKTVSGEDVIADLTKMPHCIIAGATGSGKSVCINTIVMSILMTARPDEIKLLMVDPKKVELTAYSELPHLIAPVITEPMAACMALNWLVKEMERRYELMKKVGVRNLVTFNQRPRTDNLESSKEELQNIPDKLPYIVAIIDELADLMMVSSQDIETPIARIAQMARAVGIHLILATQRPSREVITGLIKANFPTRIAFKVASRINSQIILDETGSEALLGNGDMLFLPPGTSTLTRAQGAFIRDEDINRVIQFISNQAPASYLISSFDEVRLGESPLSKQEAKQVDTLYEQALEIVLGTGNASTTFLQRKLKIGYARAASLMDQLEQQGVIGPSEGSKPRKLLHARESKNKKGSPLSIDEEDPFEYD